MRAETIRPIAGAAGSNTVTPGSHAPRVSIVVPTRNRAAHAAACAASILAIDGFADLIVVDQSDDRETEEALSRIADRRLRYVRMQTRGVTSGRNHGMELSESEIIAFTDDDCRVRPDWVRRIIDVFVADRDVAVVCGRVCVPEEIQHLGYAEGFQPHVREWQGRYPPLGRDWGITANLSLRRSVLPRVGAFDPMLGAGAPLRSGGEPDFLFRALRAGFKVVNAEEVVVDHLGIRKHGEEVRNLILGYGAGTAAALFKHVRLWDPAGTLVYLRFLASAVFQVPANVLLRRRPTGAGYLMAFLSGTFASYRFRVDRQRRQYVER
jgi:glycosyltransferase involved in cell wall biosynthesis